MENRYSLIGKGECACEQEFSSDNTLFKICEQYSRSAYYYVYLNRKGYERDSE